MKRLKYFLLILLLFVVIAAAALCIRYMPYLRGAAFLQKNLDLEKMSFDVTVTLSQEGFTKEQAEFVEGLSQVTGVDKEDLLALRLQGSTWQDMVYVQITPGGADTERIKEPLTELYLGKENDMVNARMLYDAALNQLREKLGMLGGLLPEWKGGEYVTLAQAEEMFALDLHSAREFEIAKYKEWFSFPTYFAMMFVMDYEQAGEGTVEFSVENMPDTLQKLDEMLAKAGVEHRFSQKAGLRNMQSIEGVVSVKEPAQLQMPESLIQQDTVEKIATVRKIMQELLGGIE